MEERYQNELTNESISRKTVKPLTTIRKRASRAELTIEERISKCFFSALADFYYFGRDIDFSQHHPFVGVAVRRMLEKMDGVCYLEPEPLTRWVYWCDLPYDLFGDDFLRKYPECRRVFAIRGVDADFDPEAVDTKNRSILRTCRLV
jgi:hypothetical protein